MNIKIVGLRKVGKTSYLRRLQNLPFESTHVPSEYKEESLNITVENVLIRLSVGLSVGLESVDGIIFMFDNRLETLKHVLRESLKTTIPHVFVRNKDHLKMALERPLVTDIIYVNTNKPTATSTACRIPIVQLIYYNQVLPLTLLAACKCHSFIDKVYIPKRLVSYVNDFDPNSIET